MSKLERRQFIRGLAAGAAGGLTAWIQRALAADAKSLPQGIVESRGDVLVNGKPATKGSPVAPGDVVETGKGARAVYLIDDNVFLQRQNSRVEFGNSVETFLRIVTGGLLGVFGKGGRELTTPVGTIRDARGSGLVM